MKKLLYIMVLVGAMQCQTDRQKPRAPELGIWDYSWMQQVKKGLEAGDATYRPALERLLAEAESAMQAGPFSVTYKKLVPPSGSKHDYMSMGPYWWPDPEKEDGLPYIRKDGEINPERNETDRPQLGALVKNVRILSLAWFYSGERAYAKRAAELLRVWFLNEDTRMNPHLEYAQSIPGITPGRFIGLIDGASFHILVDAIGLLETSGTLSTSEMDGLQDWFRRYFRWLTESDHGKNEDAYKNNHSVAYDVQSSGIAFFIGDKDFVARKARELPRRRIDPMIEADGRQPEELIRTKAFSYSVGNLRNFFNVGERGLKVDVNIFHYTNTKGGSLSGALDYLMQFIGKSEAWPYQQITSWEATEDNLGLLVRRAAVIYDSEKYKQVWQQVFFDRLKDDWNLLVTRGFDEKVSDN